ncbi:acyl carrier protein [Gynuella sp.]|uniref:acyl carrier protein n=1 Tax=Gynuella sp. TaxID=2969146 RepID=UPI003D14096C
MTSLVTTLLNKLSFAETQQENLVINETSIKDWLIQRMAKMKKIPPAEVDTARTFEEYGLDSIVAVRVVGDLEKFIDQRLSPALLFEYQSIDELSSYLANELNTQEA